MSTSETIEYAGDYELKDIQIRSFDGKPVNIKAMFAELNIYESIFKTAMTGSIVITDAQNMIAKMPLQGTEQLEFKLYTPGAHLHKHGLLDASAKTGHPFHIYSLTNRKEVSEGTQKYILHFCSREMLRSVRTRVSQAYTGPLHQTAAKIFTDQEYLDSRKKLYVEPTRNSDTIVIPNMRPLDAIDMLANKSLSGNAKGAGYYFYETTKGYHFRSWENMVAIQGKYPRDSIQDFDYRIRKIEKDGTTHHAPNKKNDILTDLESVQDYEFLNTYDSAAHQAMGTYGQTVITHNIYDKSYDITPFKYHPNYSDFRHADDTGRGDHAKYTIPKVPVDFDGEKTVSDFTESSVALIGTTQYSHNESTGSFGTDVSQDGKTEAIKNMQFNSIDHGITVKLEVHGQSYLQSGDVIWFKLRSLEPGKGVPTTGSSLDKYYSGRYVITHIRHRVTDPEYKMVLTCVKDSVWQGYDSSTYKILPSKDSGQIINIYNMDQAVRTRTAGHHQ
tara:strand:+ start:270 stop:1772 length:1503 start_codon:yes stop_codon:yes gene_type:complete